MKNMISPCLAALCFSAMLAGCTGVTEIDLANPSASASQGQESGDNYSGLKAKLGSGTPEEKEAVLNLFMEEYPIEMVSSVIDAILDDTVSPSHGDTGWARVHHQAATAMCKFAYRIDGKPQKERGLDNYSFFNDGGVGTESRRKEVHQNWLKWWRENQKDITKPSTATE